LPVIFTLSEYISKKRKRIPRHHRRRANTVAAVRVDLLHGDEVVIAARFDVKEIAIVLIAYAHVAGNAEIGAFQFAGNFGIIT